MENYTINPPFEVVSFDEQTGITKSIALKFKKILSRQAQNVDQSRQRRPTRHRALPSDT